jgi:hypothetical protein
MRVVPLVRVPALSSIIHQRETGTIIEMQVNGRCGKMVPGMSGAPVKVSDISCQG